MIVELPCYAGMRRIGAIHKCRYSAQFSGVALADRMNDANLPYWFAATGYYRSGKTITAKIMQTML